MRKREIDEKMDDIIAFSGVSKFIDTPVKRYSSGMKVRVGFAVAAHLEPEILIIDEVLAVGDVEFQQKCIGKMKDIAGQGRTVLFVSHNLSAVRALCTRGIVLRGGRVAMDGPVDEAVNFYLEGLGNPSTDPFESNPERSGSHVARFTGAHIINAAGEETTQLTAGEPVTFELPYENLKAISKAYVTMTIYNELGVPTANFDMEINGYKIGTLKDRGLIRCRVDRLPLPMGRYRLAVAMIHKGIGMADHVPNALKFTVENSTFFQTGRTPQIKFSSCMVDHEWDHVDVPSATAA
jgi:lipopolysaccharide transport system ATP-binding protein